MKGRIQTVEVYQVRAMVRIQVYAASDEEAAELALKMVEQKRDQLGPTEVEFVAGIERVGVE